jgi:hypothetical protein
MQNSVRLAALSGALLLAIGGDALAQDPKFAHSSEEDLTKLAKASEVEWKAGAQTGLILTTGNSRSTSLSAGAKASRQANKNKLQIEAGGAYIRSSILLANDANGDGFINPGEFERQTQTTAEMWEAKARYDRFLTKMDSLYVSAQGMGNEPAGKTFVGGGQVGYSRLLIKNDRREIVAELGYDLSFENPVAGKGYDNHSLRAFLGYQSKIGKETGLDASIEGLFNLNELETPTGHADLFEDARVNGKLSFTTQLLEDISFRLGFLAQYDNVPSPLAAFATPFEDGFVPPAEELDTKTEATLIISFL